MKSVGHPDRAVKVLCEYVASQTVFGVVSFLNCLFLRLELDEGTNRAEDLLSSELHVKMGIGNDGRLDEVSFSSMSYTSSENIGAFSPSRLNISHDALSKGR